MNYIAEINAFNEWCEIHYLPMSSQFLWYKLMAKNNRLGWCEWVSVDNCELMGILGLKREQTAVDIRDKLVDAGLLKIIKGKKGTPNKYKMISLSNLKVNTAVESDTLSKMKVYNEVNTAVKSVVNTAIETADINKHKHKQNKTKKDIFVPPTPDEVREYCLKRQNNINPETFWEYYNESGWIDSRGNPVRNWKLKIVTWENRQPKTASTSIPQKKSKFNNFDTIHKFDFEYLQELEDIKTEYEIELDGASSQKERVDVEKKYTEIYRVLEESRKATRVI